MNRPKLNGNVISKKEMFKHQLGSVIMDKARKANQLELRHQHFRRIRMNNLHSSDSGLALNMM